MQAFNSQQYDNFEATIGGEFLESVRENGVLVPLAVTKSGLVLSGHRRLAAAKKSGHEKVPCNVYSNAEDYEKQRLTYDLNLHHQRSAEETARRLKYKLDMEQGKRSAGAPISAQELPKSPVTGRTLSPLEAVAKSEGIGKAKAAQMLETIETIDELTEKGDSETVDVIRDKLENQSVNAAHKVVQAVRQPVAKPVEPDTTEEDESRAWTKSDVNRFKSAFSTLIRMVDNAAERELCTAGEHKALLDQFKQFGRNWQMQFYELEWL
jgi:ParB-like chromosome segregation protein Spo0J